MRRDAPPASLLSTLPWLLDANVWSFSAHGEHVPVDRRGVWPVGNGWVFAHAGLVPPCNRLCGIVGPTYQTEEPHSVTGAFGDCWLELRSERGSVPLEQEEIWRPRKSGVLVTQEHDQDVALVTIDFAPPGRHLIVRIVELWNAPALGSGAVILVHLPAGQPDDARRRTLRAHGGPGRVLVVGAVVAGRYAGPGLIKVDLEEVPVNAGLIRFLVLLSAGPDAESARRAIYQATDAVTMLEDTQSHWHLWLEKTRTPRLWPQNLPGPTATARAIADLIELNKINLKMQQAEPHGAVSPMVHYKGAWARDSNGPLRAFLAMRAREDAQHVLEYHYRAAIVLGRVPNSAPLDLHVTGVGEPDDWSGIAVPHAEVPSWLILQHRWWLEAGGDVELVRRHWAYLRRCATGQQVTPDGLLTFHGDETYLHGALYALFPERVGWPNEFIADDIARGYAPWSLDSMVLYVAAHEAMAWMSERAGRGAERAEYEREAGRVREVIERRFWMPDRGYYAPAIYPLSGARHEAPFAPINLCPLWVRYLDGRDPRARSNLNAVVEMIGFRGTTPNCEFTTGHSAGYLLWNLLEADSPLAPLGLANLVGMASPAGEWAEIHGPDGRPHGSYDPAMPNRLRPWESGVNLDAVYRYFARRRARDEPEAELLAITHEDRTKGSGPFRAFWCSPPPAPQRVVVIAADRREVEVASKHPKAAGGEALTVLEPGIPMGPDYLAKLLFDASDGRRRTDVVIIGASAVAGDRRSMKTDRFWRHPVVVETLERFERAGGEVVGAEFPSRDA